MTMEGKLMIQTVEMHTGGEPLRIIVSGENQHDSVSNKKKKVERVYSILLSGYPPVLGDTILEKLHYVHSNLDHHRVMLMCEPRGHTDMYGALLVEKDLMEADMAVIFTHSQGELLLLELIDQFGEVP